MAFAAPVTVFVGENGSGKSTLLEALACALRLPAIGADDTALDATLASVRPLADALKLTFPAKPGMVFSCARKIFSASRAAFPRCSGICARSLLAWRKNTGIAARLPKGRQNGLRLFAGGTERALWRGSGRALARRKFSLAVRLAHSAGGLYLLDEPESPLSPTSQLALLAMLMDRESDCQFILATHSPILMAYPGAQIWSFDAEPPQIVPYEDLENIQLMRDFLNQPDRYIARLRNCE